MLSHIICASASQAVFCSLVVRCSARACVSQGAMNACSMVEKVDVMLSAECCNKLASNVRPRPMSDSVSLFSLQVCGPITSSNYFQTNGPICDEDSLPGTSKNECPPIFFNFASSRSSRSLLY